MSKFPGLYATFGGGGGTNSSGFVSGGSLALLDIAETTAEMISGGNCVAYTNSGKIQIARAGISGRMPSLGYCIGNFLSGTPAVIYIGGLLQWSGFNFSGWTTDPVYVGWSGQANASGSPQNSGDIQQIIGQTQSASGLFINVGDPFEPFTASSGDIGSGAILGQAGGGFLNVSSGTLSTYDLGSGAIVRAAQFVTPFQSGTNWSLLSQETISGVRAVNITQSGTVQVAMCSISGRFPVHGICVDNVLSGIPVNIYTWGAFQVTSGLADYSGYLGKTIYCGRSGSLVTSSGSFNSGGLSLVSGGDFVQRLGTAYNSGAFLLSLDPTVLQNQLLGTTDLIDATNRGFNF